MSADHPFAALVADYVAECLPLAEEVVDRALALERAWGGSEEGADLQAPLKGLLHTVKGNSGMMGFTAMQGLAHALEDLTASLAAAPARRPQGAELLVRGTELLSDLIRGAATGEVPEARSEGVISEIRGFLARSADLPSEAPRPERREGERRGEGAGTPARGTAEFGADGAVSTIRVDSERLDALLEDLGEVMIAEAGLRDAVRRAVAAHRDLAEGGGLEQASLALERSVKRLERGLMATRLLPIATVFGRFTRLVRDVARSEQRKVRLEVAGGETRLDKTVIDRLGEPLIHLVTNAIVHGVEPPEERAAAGKPAEAVVMLRAAQRSDRVVLTVSDDGRGLDPDRILARARSLGLVGSETPAREEIFALAFHPGLSTADQVSTLAGRGVGLDVVAGAIRALGGQVTVNSEPGRGTTFTLRLPLTMAVLRALLVEVNRERYALPLADVAETVRLDPAALHTVAGQGMLTWRDQVIPVVDGAQAVAATGERRRRRYCVVLRSAARHRGMLVDALLGQQELVVKALDPALGRPAAVAGTTILGDGSVACILDAAQLGAGAGLGAA